MKKCPRCGSVNLVLHIGGQVGMYRCKDCSYIGPLVIEEDEIKIHKKNKKLLKKKK